jgi:hypothetical protein
LMMLRRGKAMLALLPPRGLVARRAKIPVNIPDHRIGEVLY